MRKLILYEDNGDTAEGLKRTIESLCSVEVVICATFQAVKAVIKEHEFFGAILDGNTLEGIAVSDNLRAVGVEPENMMFYTGDIELADQYRDTGIPVFLKGKSENAFLEHIQILFMK